jgi:hypothetical protein
MGGPDTYHAPATALCNSQPGAERRMFAALAALIVGGGLVIAMYWSLSYSEGAWYTNATLLVFAGLQPLKLVVRLEKGKLHTALLCT